MNDILAKPFTKNGLFGILDKHLIHLKAIQLSGEVPRSVGVPPLSAQGIYDALNTTAHMIDWVHTGSGEGGGDGTDADDGQLLDLRNPLAGMGWSDDAYQIILSVRPLCSCFCEKLSGARCDGVCERTGAPGESSALVPRLTVQQFMQNGGALPEGADMNFTPQGGVAPMPPATSAMITEMHNGNGVIGTNLVFGNANRKRSLEMLDDDWSPTPGTTDTSPVVQQAMQTQAPLAVPVGKQVPKKARK